MTTTPNPDCTVCLGTGEDPDFGGTCSMCEGFVPRQGGMGETLQAHRTGGPVKRTQATPVEDDSWKKQARWTKQGDEFFILTPKSMKVTTGDTVTVNRKDKDPADVILGAKYDKDDYGATLWYPTRTPRPVATPAPSASSATQDAQDTLAEPGMYTKRGDVYKVQVGRESGRSYALVLVKLDTPVEIKRGKEIVLKTHDWVMAKGMVYRLRPEDKMSFDEAKAWGVEHTACCVCGITLYNKVSVELGIGPICRSKF